MDEKYQEYLCSREWGLKRESVVMRSRGICERCLINTADAVHHRTYARKYNELISDLIHLCNACHDFQHGRSSVDPARVNLEPVRVYMAGKVVRTAKSEEECPKISCWRDGIFSNTDKHGGVQDTLGRQDSLEGRFVYGGPIIEYGGGHCCAYDKHSLSTYDIFEKWRKKNSWKRNASRAEFCLEQLEECDVVFAWIDEKEAIGTVAEIGLARGFGIAVFIALATEELSSYFYFAHGLADECVIAPSAIEGWNIFVNWCEMESRSWWRKACSQKRA